MSTLYGATIDVNKFIENLKKGHSAFWRNDKGEVKCNINIWHNDQPDQYGNEMSIQLNSKQDKRETEGKIYIANAKKVKPKEPEAVKVDDIPDLADLPF